MKKTISAGSGVQKDSGGDTQDFASTLAALEQTVQRMEAGQLGLEESVALFQRGVELAGRAEAQLRGARQKVDLLLGDSDIPLPLPEEEDQ